MDQCGEGSEGDSQIARGTRPRTAFRQDPRLESHRLLHMEEGLLGPLTFLRPPSVMSQKPIERWGIPPFPFNLGIFAVYPPDNLLTVAEEKEE